MLETYPIGGTTGSELINVVSMTQAQYDGLGSKDAATLYVISG